MKIDEVVEDISRLLRARCSLLWVVTREELRAERVLARAAERARYELATWDCASGLQCLDADGRLGPVPGTDPSSRDPGAALDFVRRTPARRIYVMRDLHKWFDPMVVRNLRSLDAYVLRREPSERARAVVVLSPSAEVPPELADHATVIDLPLPDRPEVEQVLAELLGGMAAERRQTAVPTPAALSALVDAGAGLTAAEVADCYTQALAASRGGAVDPKVMAQHKRRVVARERVLTWYEPDPRGLDAVGGYELLKDWLRDRRAAFSEEARAYGLPPPKGVFLVGPPGTGKSLTAKAVAAAWGMPLLRLDMGALRSKYVGDSEQNIRKALALAEAIAPAVLWLDEVEKALGGSTGPQGDGGVSADALGAVLTWMQERAGSVFFVATSNDVRQLPPELLRKGRFDELFFVDLPNGTERVEVLRAALRQHGRASDVVPTSDLAAVSAATDGFSGAEIAALVPDALYAAFREDAREVTAADLIAAARAVVPLSRTAGERVRELREWAKGRARFASRPDDAPGAAGRVRQVED